MSHITHPPENASPRRVLAHRRASVLVTFELDGRRYTASGSYFPDGTLAEVFLNAAKHSSEIDASVRDSAIVASLAFQFGAPVHVIRHALNPASPLGLAIDQLSKGGHSG